MSSSPTHLTTSEVAALNLQQLAPAALPAAPAVPLVPSVVLPRAGFFGSAVMRLIMLFLIVFIVGTTLALGQARSTADDAAAALNELLVPPRGCSMPCWHGIQPGMTTADEAVSILEALPYVDAVHISPTMISWWWAEDHPAVYDANGRAFDGRIELAIINGEQRVSAVVLLTTLEFGQIQLALGEPDEITLYTVHPDSPSQHDGIVHLAQYNSLIVFNILQCPMTVENFWHSGSYVAFGMPTLVFEGEIYEMQQLPGWFFRDEAPGCQ